MDVARQAFVRHLALDKYREIEDMRETLGFETTRAAEEACTFLGRGRYREIWRRHWGAVAVPAARLHSGGDLLSAIEEALARALAEEEQARAAGGDRPLEEEAEYKGFVDACMERIHVDGADIIERPG
ncbi:MAG: hypothetical protein ACREJG_04375 [Candidatus Rokuibacteriota bacterium]